MEEPNEKYLEKLVGCEWEEREDESKLRQTFLCYALGGASRGSSWCWLNSHGHLCDSSFPQALTSCCHLSSPFPLNFKCCLENIN